MNQPQKEYLVTEIEKYKTDLTEEKKHDIKSTILLTASSTMAIIFIIESIKVGNILHAEYITDIVYKSFAKAEILTILGANLTSSLALLEILSIIKSIIKKVGLENKIDFLEIQKKLGELEEEKKGR